jgi:hypothetical protein
MWNHRGCGKGSWARYCIAFGIGLALSCFCPPGLIMFVAAVIMIALGIALLHKC